MKDYDQPSRLTGYRALYTIAKRSDHDVLGASPHNQGPACMILNELENPGASCAGMVAAGARSIIFLVLMWACMAVHAQVPAGELEVRGSARVGQPDSIGMINVRDTTYSWFSGDRIEVSSGAAILSLNDDHSFGFPEGSEVTLDIEEERILAEVHSGMLLYAIEGEDIELQVGYGDFLHIARPADELQPCYGLNATGLVHAANEVESEVIVQTGELEGGTSDRSVQYVVEPGEKVVFSPTDVTVTEIELPEEVERELDDMEDSDQLPCIIWWLREEAARGAIGWFTPGTSFLLGTATGALTYHLLFDEDEEECPICPPPPSP